LDFDLDVVLALHAEALGDEALDRSRVADGDAFHLHYGDAAHVGVVEARGPGHAEFGDGRLDAIGEIGRVDGVADVVELLRMEGFASEERRRKGVQRRLGSKHAP
jgi:hypothetical protein